MNTRITELFSTDIPIVSGGMVWCSGWWLASAVSNAGGLGLIGAGSMSEEVLSQHIELCRQATAGTFGVNIPLMNANSAKHIECVMKHKVHVVFTSAGNPALYTTRLKEAGCKVVHVVANEKFALKAQSAGCDAVVAEGFEAGGHNGKEETTTLVLIQQLADRLTLPLIAAGGIATGVLMAAVMALGADGVQVGSAFAVAKESSAHEAFKQAVFASKEGDTKLMLRKLSPTRLLKGTFFDKIAEAEARGADAEELLSIIDKGRTKKGMFDGDLEEGELEIGQVASMLDKEKTAAEIIEDFRHGFKKAQERLQQIR